METVLTILTVCTCFAVGYLMGRSKSDRELWYQRTAAAHFWAQASLWKASCERLIEAQREEDRDPADDWKRS